MKKELVNIEASVHDKLNNKRKELNISFLEILVTYAMERFLYRLSKAAFADDFILKGALLFTAWKVSERRTTLDIDLLAPINRDRRYFILKTVIYLRSIVDDVCFL
ncbi:MAG: nucleotidyl transferase AbiEii/AbiGii toxin family protein [Candidatus Omnitrophica bacterium]|nr:nucleotidyl transferase AbiEii/AbiGii toxin family protein [Candidatus Omnitrophota bacterium]